MTPDSSTAGRSSHYALPPVDPTGADRPIQYPDDDSGAIGCDRPVPASDRPIEAAWTPFSELRRPVE